MISARFWTDRKRDPKGPTTARHRHTRTLRIWMMVTAGLVVVGGIAVASGIGRGGPQSPAANEKRAVEPAGQSKNQLARSASPYLQEAALQPVHWHPWGTEPFELAQRENKPILLDIGAVWCHWCHVMDRESYENEEIAALVNQYFVAIKVDMDERPDIDRRYQQAVSTISGSGGWPLTAFLTPQGKVFYGGTYFPPEDRYGRPGLKTLLPKLAEIYHTKTAEVLASAEHLSSVLAQIQAASFKPGELSDGLVQSITTNMVQAFDPAHGGFGTGVKFPAVGAVELALAKYFVDGDTAMLKIATTTLDAMARGGVYDQIGGGFFRYSTDPRWIVPHFEKMSDDNAGLLLNYLHAYQATRNARYREIAEGIIDYLNRVLSDQENGGFYVSQDADMTREDDGDYYTWTVEEVKSALDEDEAKVMLRFFDIKPNGEMRENPAKNVPFIATSADTLARELALPVDRIKSLIATGTQNLLHARSQRKTPLVDTTLYADRNGMLISAYLEAFQVLGERNAKAFALRTLDRFIREGYRKGQGMYHALSGGQGRLSGFLSDQVYMSRALLDAFQVTGEQRYLSIAQDLMNYAVANLWDAEGGGFIDRHREETPLAALSRPVKDFDDNPNPSPNAVAALALDQLGYLTNNADFEQKARETLQSFAGSAAQYGSFAATYALAVHNHLNQSIQAVIVGKKDNPRTRELWMTALKTYRPLKIVAVYDPSELNLAELPPAVAGAVQAFGVDGAPRAYICAGATCAPPTGDSEEVVTLVQRYGLAKS